MFTRDTFVKLETARLKNMQQPGLASSSTTAPTPGNRLPPSPLPLLIVKAEPSLPLPMLLHPPMPTMHDVVFSLFDILEL